MILNFKEIPPPYDGSGVQDTFELFTREFMHQVGYEIIDDPNRGADGGKDLIVKESRIGVGGTTELRWLVSCKHKAHSGKSVTQNDEQDIYDRVIKNNCSGFIGFYSTIVQSTLAEKLKNLPNIEYQFFDKEKIERHLLYNYKGIELAKRFFPDSINKWLKNNKARKLINWSADDSIISIELSEKYWVVLLGILEQTIPMCLKKMKELRKQGFTPDNLKEIPSELRIAYTAPILIRGIIIEELHKAGVVKDEAKQEAGIYEVGEKARKIMEEYAKNKKKSH